MEFLFGLIVMIGIFAIVFLADWYDYKRTGHITVDVYPINKIIEKTKSVANDLLVSSNEQIPNNYTMVDIHGMIEYRMKDETGLESPTYYERIVKNTGKLERKYRREYQIADDHALYNRTSLDDGFFYFVMGYILEDYFFDKHNWLLPEDALKAASVDPAPEAEPFDVDFELEDDNYDSDSFDFDSDDFDSDSFDSDDFDSDDFDPDDFDSDDYDGYDPRDRCVTFQDDYGNNGDDMYSYDGEFLG